MFRKPRPSQIALLGTVGILAVLAISIFVSAVFDRTRISLTNPAGAAVQDERIAGIPDLRGFRELALVGRWQAEITRGDDWNVELSYHEALEDLVRWELVGDRLELEFDPPIFQDVSGIFASARITMPELVRLDIKGHNQVRMQDFEGDRFALHIKGNNVVGGDSGYYDALDLSIAGMNQVDLGTIRVRKADVHIAGNTGVTLSMDGGELSGSIAGAGSLGYHGTVSSETVRVAGVASIRRLD